MKFSKIYKSMDFSGMDTPFEVKVESRGDSIEEILGNVKLTLTDEFGDTGPNRDLNDLEMMDYYTIQYDVAEELCNHQAEYYSRGH